MPSSFVCSLGIGKGSSVSGCFRDAQSWIPKTHREGDRIGLKIRIPIRLNAPVVYRRDDHSQISVHIYESSSRILKQTKISRFADYGLCSDLKNFA